MRAIETLICRREMGLKGFYTKYDTQFSKYGTELIVALSSTNATEIDFDLDLHEEDF